MPPPSLNLSLLQLRQDRCSNQICDQTDALLQISPYNHCISSQGISLTRKVAMDGPSHPRAAYMYVIKVPSDMLGCETSKCSP